MFRFGRGKKEPPICGTDRPRIVKTSDEELIRQQKKAKKRRLAKEKKDRNK